MAEGFARRIGGEKFEVWSAGSMPSGKVNKTAVEAMREKDIDLSKNKSKGLSNLPQQQWDYVVTMGCGDACPVVPAKAKFDWPLPDPKKMPLDQFRVVRDQIEKRVRELIEKINSK